MAEIAEIGASGGVISIATAVVGAIFAAGAAYEATSRDKNLKTQGQNDITEEDCFKVT